MNRSVIVAAIAVVVAAAAPALTGWIVERGSDERLETVTDAIPLLSVRAHSYRRGWFSSDETITFEFLKGMKLPAPASPPPAEGAAPPPRLPYLLTVHNVIQHGPLPGLSSIGLARVESELTFARGEPTPAAQPAAATAPRIETVLSLLGGGRTTVASKAYAGAALKGHAHMTADPVEVVIDFARNIDRFDVDVKAPHVLVWEDDGSKAELSGLHAIAHNHRVLRTLYGGDSELTLGSLDVSGIPAKDGPIAMGLKVVHMKTQADAAGDFLNTSVLFTISAADAAGKTVQGIKFDASADHWQTDAFERLAAGSRAVTRGKATDTAAQTAAILKLWQSAGVALAIHDPVFTIRDLEFVTPDGFAKLSGSVGIKGATESDFATPINTGLLIPKFTLDFDITVDEELAAVLKGQAARKPEADAPAAKPPAKGKALPVSAPPDPLQSMIAQGFVTREGGKLHSKILFAKGVLTVNGKPFPGAPPAAAH